MDAFIHSKLADSQNDNFKKWFGSSVTVNEIDKLPLVFYHKSRSPEVFSEFRHTDIEKNPYNNDYGFYFVQEHAKSAIHYIGEGVDFYVYLKMEKPYTFYDTGKGAFINMDGKEHSILTIHKSTCDSLIGRGFDSIIILTNLSYGQANQYIVFNPNQIKSATNNTGSFSIETNNIFE